MIPEIPQSVLAKVDHVINLAHKGKTSLFKASELLGGTIEAYQYAREAAQDTFDIHRRSQQLLDQHDESFRQMIDCRINANIPEAERHEAQCFEHLSESCSGSLCNLRIESRTAEVKGLVFINSERSTSPSL